MEFAARRPSHGIEISEGFRVSRERAELEVLTQGSLRYHCVLVEWASNVLEPLVRWILTYWIGVRKKVRKCFSHYGAVMACERPGSGRDPGNKIYAVALLVAGDMALDTQSYWELSRRNEETLGDLFESVLGYAWWLRYRGDVSRREFGRLFYAELMIKWCPKDLDHLWDEWEKQHPLEEWVEWIEQLAMGIESLVHLLPRAFHRLSTVSEDYDRVRLGLRVC